MSATPARSRWPDTRAPRRVPRGSTARISHRDRKGRWGVLRVRKTVAEAQFLALGEGAVLWLTEAAAAGCSRIRAKMAEAVDLAALHDAAVVDRTLGQAATAGRFAHGDLAAILSHQAGDPDHGAGQPARAGEHNSLAQGTAGWAALGEQEVS